MTASPGSTRSPRRRRLSYIDRSREFYAAHGYEQPYEWAVHDHTPFAGLGRPLDQCRVGVVTTAFPADWEGRKRVTTVPSSPVPEAMFTADLSWHKEATHTDDVDTFLPLRALDRARQDGRIADVAPSVACAPTLYSQRRTARDAELVAEWVAAEAIDVVLLVPL